MADPIVFKQVESDLSASERITTNLNKAGELGEVILRQEIVNWPLEKFQAVPRELVTVPEGARSAVVVPAGESEDLHDSGYRTVTLVFFDDVGRCLGRTAHDHDHIQVFALQQGDDYRAVVAGQVKAHGYESIEMDWLPVSGLMRFWTRDAGFEYRGLLMSTASLRPGKQFTVPLRSDAMKDVKRKMFEWGREFGAEQLRVALDEMLEKL